MKESRARLCTCTYTRGNAAAKLWLEPVPEVAGSHGMAAHVLRELLDVAVEHKTEIARFWNEHFGS